MKEILKNKLLIIFLIAFLVASFTCSCFYSVYASETLTYEGKDGKLNEFIVNDNLLSTAKYIMVFSLKNCDACYLFYSNKPMKVSVSNNMYTVYGEGFKALSGGVSNHVPSSDEDYSTTVAEVKFAGITDSRIFYANFNVYDTEGKLVFQGAPLEEVELMRATQVEEIPQQINRVLMIVIPIFLLIFGTLLVLYLIRSKNLLHL